MANNHVSSLLNFELPKPKRSNFNLGRVNRFSADVGWLIPCYVEEVLPNSHKRLDVESLIQTNATIAPLLSSFKAKIDCFFVPLRLYHRHLDLNNIRPDFNDDFDFHYLQMPTLDNTYTLSVEPSNNVSSSSFNSGVSSGARYFTTQWNIPISYSGDTQTVAPVNLPLFVSPCSLIDYLGILPVGYNHISWKGSKHLNGTPFIAYFDIFRNYYANPHDPNIPFRVQNTITDRPDIVSSRPVHDVYVPLERFDSFITDFTDEVGSSLDVFSVFNRHFYSASSLVYPSYIPLFGGQFSTSGTRNLGGSIEFITNDTRDGIHFGLLRRTYMDDYFTARFQNDFVTYMEESSKVVVNNNTFTISQLRMQNRIAKYVDKSIFADTRFGSWIKAHFGVKTNQKLNIPQFLGSIQTNIIFEDIKSLAQTGDGDISSNQALGSKASLGQGYINNKGSFVEFTATEPGYIVCLFSIIPYVSYFQGIRKMYLKTGFYDLYRPEFDAVGYDDLQRFEMDAVGYAVDPYANNVISRSFVISSENYSVGKHPSWMEYMTSVDESHGLLASRFNYGFWTNNRPFNSNNYDKAGVYSKSEDAKPSSTTTVNNQFNFTPSLPNFDPSTYINPELFNTIFAVDKYTDNFIVQIRFYDRTKQPIGKQILPHL